MRAMPDWYDYYAFGVLVLIAAALVLAAIGPDREEP